ncbi:Zn(2)-C6 fungal-type DNA-binding domain [Phaffia rhodozyma]|uniref:Zn(2)-C6 fungal-type DNA-binding domain n=1 Tax=Phaffia rhodozyma TaxID=264483 RepID=A0A0F7ST08_PHARH|nr:Zn(2)-C6 fungal-type DNA-binding domain [Phaffia rhodozyma]
MPITGSVNFGSPLRDQESFAEPPYLGQISSQQQQLQPQQHEQLPPSKKLKRQSSQTRMSPSPFDEASSDEGDEDDDGEGEEGEEESDVTGRSKPKVNKGKRNTDDNGSVEPVIGPDGKPLKVKATRGSRACTVCRKLKMRCFSENGPPCKRCAASGQECVFEESNRGKKSTKKHEAMAQSLRKMEQTLDTVLRSIHNPSGGLPSGMVTRTPSPINGTPPIPTGANPLLLLQQHHQHQAGTPQPATSLPSIQSMDYPEGSQGASIRYSGGLTNSAASQAVLDGILRTAPRDQLSNTPLPSTREIHPQSLPPSSLPAPLSLGMAPGGSNSGYPGTYTPYNRAPYPWYKPSSHSGPNQPSGGPQHLSGSTFPSSTSMSSSFTDGVNMHMIPPPRPHSPRLHSLPDNSLNPLGLLAEASLHNHRRQEQRALMHGAGLTNRSGLLIRNLVYSGGTSSNNRTSHSTSSSSSTVGGGGLGVGGEYSRGSIEGGLGLSANSSSVSAFDNAASGMTPAASLSKRSPSSDLASRPNGSLMASPLSSAGGGGGSGNALALASVLSGTSSRGIGNGGNSDVRSRAPSPIEIDTQVGGEENENGQKPDRSEQGASEEDEGVRVRKGKKIKIEEEKPTPIGVAASGYFKPGPMTMLPLRKIIIERSIRPEILDFLTTEEVVELFDIYFKNIHGHVPVLDNNFHTPSLVASRSPFLLTTICSIASRYYNNPEKPDLTKKLNACVRKLAFETPSLGHKSVEIVQAFLLLCSYGLPVERFEQDKTWLLLGMGIRIATDLNLQRKSVLSGKNTEEAMIRDREIVNRERTWLMCYILDRSLSAQMGKPYTIREDFIIRNSATWRVNNPFANPFDEGLLHYVHLQQILSRCLDHLYSGISTASGLRSDLDYPLFLASVEAQIFMWLDTWESTFSHTLAGVPEHMRHHLLAAASSGRFYFNYALLMVNSFGLQAALDKSPIDVGNFFTKVASAASNVITIAKDDMAATGRLRYAPDSNFIMLSYAILSLLKLLRPELTAYLDTPSRILNLANAAVEVLDEISVSPHHTPAMYSSLLRSLLSPNETRPPTRAPSPLAASNGLNKADGSATGNAESVSNGFTEAGMEWAVPSFAGEEFGEPVNSDLMNAFEGMDDSWTEADGVHMESVWPGNGAGLWDSMLMPGFGGSTEVHGHAPPFANGATGFITPALNSPTQDPPSSRH